ncbi:hypothetical protein Hdeb2414_s0046g00747341 [Helianthus debilis subsp. tardiflorus]
MILSLSIRIQKTVMVACKMIALIPIFFVISVMCCFHCWKSLKVMSIASYNVSIETPSKLECDKNLSQYVLQLQDDMELAEKTLNNILKSVTNLIQSAEKNFLSDTTRPETRSDPDPF